MQIQGTIKNIIFRSDDTGFTVLELIDESGDEITAESVRKVLKLDNVI